MPFDCDRRNRRSGFLELILSFGSGIGGQNKGIVNRPFTKQQTHYLLVRFLNKQKH